MTTYTLKIPQQLKLNSCIIVYNIDFANIFLIRKVYICKGNV